MISGEGKYFDLVRVPDGDREAWLAERRKGVGGSDVAAIMGLSPWKTPYQVWLEKVTGVSEDISERPAVEWGNRLEPLIGEKYRDNHPDREVRRVNAVLRSIARPWAQASLDYEVKDPDLGWGVLEIKTAGLRAADRWEEGVPTFYLTQVTHYLSVSGRPFADVAVLIGGQDYREYRVMRDEDDVATVDTTVDVFWNINVMKHIEPEVLVSDGPALAEAHSEATEDLVVMDDEPLVFKRWKLAKAELDAAKAEKERWDAKLKQEIGDSRGWSMPTGDLTWVRSKSTRYDYKRLDAEHPGLREEYATCAPKDGGLRFREAK